ncbi:hypothetical protein F4805DRAFT_476850 [Annulohypoxylon moriforme]|nr:hypothetical protein F4805DRAFT_476850 [Annulohypoxylon moriforme]
MEKLDFPDHDTYWENDPIMRDQTKAYKEWALATVNGGSQSRCFPDYKWHPWLEFGADVDANINVFELQGDHCNGKVHFQFNNPRDILMHFENTSKGGTSGKPNRRMILLQGMHPRIVELLGVKLDIPPHFFLAHCDRFVDLHIIDETYAKKSSSVYWRVPVPRRCDVPDDLIKGDYYVEAGNISRGEHELCPGGSSSFENFVSYWGKNYESDSWTIVILIDPYKIYLRSASDSPSNTLARYEMGSSTSRPGTLQEVMNSGIGSNTCQWFQRSTLDAMVAAYSFEQLNKLPLTKDPFTGTTIVRNIIRSAWQGYVLTLDAKTFDLIIDDDVEHPSNSSSQDTNIIDSYHELMHEQQSILLDKNTVSLIMWEFRCKDVLDSSRKNNTSQDDIDQTCIQDDSGEEWKAWNNIYEQLSRTESTISKYLEMWSQRAALEQAAAANRSARTSGQLAKIATIIVPGSFVASIFSMGGQFAAGEDHFFVYWLVSIPVTLALLTWVVGGEDIQNGYRNFRAMDKMRRIKQFRPWRWENGIVKPAKFQHARE